MHGEYLTKKYTTKKALSETPLLRKSARDGFQEHLRSLMRKLHAFAQYGAS